MNSLTTCSGQEVVVQGHQRKKSVVFEGIRYKHHTLHLDDQLLLHPVNAWSSHGGLAFLIS